jgi:hydroxymethylglutaryl-CoA lyase
VQGIENSMRHLVKIVECPRDAWQSLPGKIPSELKADYLRMLVAAGFQHIDAVSFVSHGAVPQMADSEQVLAYFDPPADVEVIAVVVNAQGAERAIRTGAVHTLGFPYSISSEFLRRNQNQTPQEALLEFEEIGTLANKSDLQVVAYLSMAFGNPYGEPWSIDEVVTACNLLVEAGAQHVSLADTVGVASPACISATVSNVLAVRDEIEIGAHLHARPSEAASRIQAAYQAGCRRFDSTIGGLGGCPFAQDALVGNIPTETLLAVLEGLGAEVPSLLPLDGLVRLSAQIVDKFGVHSEL